MAIESKFPAAKGIVAPPAHAGASQPAPAGGQGRPHSIPNLEAKIVEWMEEALASAPPPAQMHITTHLKNCLPALMEKLG